jgi:hypothetical protein
LKTLLLLTMVFILGRSAANAQWMPVSDSNLICEVNVICELNETQLTKVKPIVNSFERKRDNIYNKYGNNPVKLKTAVRKNRWDYETSLIGILTPEQMGLIKAFDQLHPEFMSGAYKRKNTTLITKE